MDSAAPGTLAQAGQLLKSVLQVTHDGMVVTARDGTILVFNDAAADMLGYRPQDVVGKPVSVLMPAGEATGDGSNLPDIVADSGIGKAGEIAVRRRDGSEVLTEINVTEVKVGEFSIFACAIRDVTARRANRRRVDKLIRNLAEAESLQRALMEGDTDYAIIILDPAGNVVLWNPGAQKLKGYTEEEIMGRNFAVFYTPEDRAAGIPKTALRVAAVEGKFEEESLRVRKDGSTFWASQVISPLRSVDGDLTGFVKVTRDITERKMAEADLHDHVEKLKRSNQELDDFAYIASHDLKEPIRGLSNNAKFLQEDFAEIIGDGGHRRLNRMIYLCGRMESLVDDLLYFSRLGRQDLAAQKVDLNGVIRDIDLMMETTLREMNAKIVVPAPLPAIVCDVPRVTEVFRNLITNAVKYNDKPDKRVEVGVARHEGKVPVFYVRDNGIGIEPRFFSDIFRIFKRLNEEDDSVKGTGVGLTFVKKIIERHGGRIWLESEPGQGTTFYFTLQTPEGH